jgi:hypothetical protein
MKQKTIKDKSNNLHVSLTCETCGEPINQTSVEFGMDCKNHCQEKAYNNQPNITEESFKKMFDEEGLEESFNGGRTTNDTERANKKIENFLNNPEKQLKK